MKKVISLLIATITMSGFQMLATASDESAHQDVLSIKQVESAPVPVKQSAPDITNDIKGIAAVVHIAFIIDENGAVQHANILKSSDERVNVAAIETVQKWTFKPAENNGSKVSVRAVVPIRFKA